MDVVIDDAVAVLKILPFGDAVCRDQYIDVSLLLRINSGLVFGYRGKEGEHGIEISGKFRNRTFPICRACDKGRLEVFMHFEVGGDLLIDVCRCVCKSRENQYFTISFIDRMMNFL